MNVPVMDEFCDKCDDMVCRSVHCVIMIVVRSALFT